MPELTREEKLKLIEKLPQQLQDFLYSEDLGAFLFHLRYKYNLTEDKVSALARAIADIVLGIAPMTGLVREIIDKKIAADAQAAMNLAQELYTELLAPVMAPTPSAPVMPSPAATPATPAPMTAAPVDRYREPAETPAAPVTPRIVDLRKPAPIAPAPFAPMYTPMPVEPAVPVPALPVPVPDVAPVFDTKSQLPNIPKGQSPLQQNATSAPGRPITPLIAAPEGGEPRPSGREADPHKISPPAMKPQYIMRPPGALPTNPPNEILDLRRDRGEF